MDFLLTMFLLMPFDSLTCPFPDLLSPPIHGGSTLVLLMLLERNKFLQLCPASLVTHHSPFFLQENSPPPDRSAPCSVAMVGGDWCW